MTPISLVGTTTALYMHGAMTGDLRQNAASGPANQPVNVTDERIAFASRGPEGYVKGRGKAD